MGKTASHVPSISEGARGILTAAVIKSVAANISNTAVAGDLQKVGKNLFDVSMKSMTYENTEWPGQDVMLNPQPEPPGRPDFYGALLTLLADAIVSADLKPAADSLRKIGSSLMGMLEAVMRV